VGSRDILAIGASAGGVQALRQLAAGLQPDLPAAVLVTLHMSNQFRSTLDALLSSAGPLPASFAVDRERLREGRIYLAPPDRHLLIEDERIVLGNGARENSSRPAIDPMLRSAALCCGHRTVGVVLTGTLGDGASGLWALKQCGGITVVQDPRRAAFPEMPQTALELARPDHVTDLDHMPALLNSLVQEPAGTPQPASAPLRFEVGVARGRGGASVKETVNEMDTLGRRSVLSCPDCQGVMWEIDEGQLTRFRCHVGHTYAGELLDLALDEGLRRALATAQRALEERVALASKLHSEAAQSGHTYTVNNWAARIREHEQELAVIRHAIQRIEEIGTREE
jgi:two-component system, chemotaxis family, protein-glutamate methylesterase/glutaminase